MSVRAGWVEYLPHLVASLVAATVAAGVVWVALTPDLVFITFLFVYTVGCLGGFWHPVIKEKT